MLPKIILQFEQEYSCPNCIGLQNQTMISDLWKIMCPKCCCSVCVAKNYPAIWAGIFLPKLHKIAKSDYDIESVNNNVSKMCLFCLFHQNLPCKSLRSLKTGIFLTFQIMVLNTLSSNIPTQIASDCKIRLGYRICKQ